MNFEKYENELVKRLKIRGVDTNTLPHVGKLNEPRPTGKPQLFILINGANLTPPENLSVPVQLETVEGEIYIRANDRRGKLGIFDLYNRLTDLLMGYELKGTKSGIVFKQFGYASGNQNNWQYSLTFSFENYRMPVEKPAEHGTIKQVETNI